MLFRHIAISDEEARALIGAYERAIDRLVGGGRITEEAAWDVYFALLHECDVRGFSEMRLRLAAKIDMARYNPFTSKNPGVQLIATLRLMRASFPKPLMN